MLYTHLPENNPYVKENFSEELKIANQFLEEGKLLMNKAFQAQEPIVAKLIKHLYSLIPGEAKYQEHFDFVNRVHVGTIFPSDDKVQKKLLEIFVLRATHACFSERYDGFYEDGSSFYTYLSTQKNTTGRRADTLRREKILTDLNEMIKEVAEFHWYTDANETGTKVWFSLKG